MWKRPSEDWHRVACLTLTLKDNILFTKKNKTFALSRSFPFQDSGFTVPPLTKIHSFRDKTPTGENRHFHGRPDVEKSQFRDR